MGVAMLDQLFSFMSSYILTDGCLHHYEVILKQDVGNFVAGSHFFSAVYDSQKATLCFKEHDGEVVATFRLRLLVEEIAC